jgi:Flp pilus assembly protein TadG
MRRRTWQRGSATVEMAVVTPLLLTLFLGIIEYGWVLSVQQALVHAAREGARVAAMPGSTDTEIRARVGQYLDGMGLHSYSTTVEHYTPTSPTETVRVQIPYGSVTLVGGYFGASSSKVLGAACSMRKEGL